jgi:hypothetical protein
VPAVLPVPQQGQCLCPCQLGRAAAEIAQNQKK